MIFLVMDSNFWLNENLNFGTDVLEVWYVYVQNITNLNLHFHPGHHKVLKTPVHGIGWKTNSELMNKQTDTVDSGPAWNNRAVLYTGPAELELYAICFFSNSLIIEQPKTKEIVDRDVFGYLMKNSSFLHP